MSTLRPAILAIGLLLALAPARLAAQKPLESLWYTVDSEESIQGFIRNADMVSIVAPQSYRMDEHGTHWGDVDPRMVKVAREKGVKIVPLIVNPGFDQPMFHALLNNPVARAKAVANIQALCRDRDYDGIQFDFENIHINDRDAFTAPGYDETPDDVARFRTSLPRHAARPGFRLVLAREPGQVGLVEFAYGYTGEPGRWWTDRLLERIPREIAVEWVGGHFEFVELAVRSSAQGRGIGRALHDALLEALPDRRALPGTWPDDRPARRRYGRTGRRDLAPIDDDSTLRGLELRG